MFRPISEYQFLGWLVGIVLYLIALILLYPLILVEILGSVSCSSSACGAGMAAQLFLKPVLILVAVVLSGIAVLKRVRGELSMFWAIFAAATIMGGWSFLLKTGNFWGANFAIGSLYPGFPWSLFCFVLFGVIMCLDLDEMPGFRGSLVGVKGPFGIPAGKVYAVTAVWLGVVALTPLLIITGTSGLLVLLYQPLRLVGLEWMLGLSVPTTLNLLAGIMLIYALRMDDGMPREEPSARRSASGGGVSRQARQIRSDAASFGRRH